MAINVEHESGLDGNVDEADAVALARLDSPLKALTSISENVHAVDETSVQSLWAAGGAAHNLRWVVERVDGGVVPILSHDNDLIVVFHRSRAVDDDRTEDTLVGLEGVMRVPPRGAVAARSPFVGHALARCNWALSDGRDTVHLVGAILTDTVEMERSTIV